MNIFFLYDKHTSTASLQQAITEVQQDYPGVFHLAVYRQHELDADDAHYAEACQVADAADLIFMVAHGGITFFKRFRDFFKRYQSTKKFFFHSGIAEEVNELMPQLNLSAHDYRMVYKYYHMRNSANLYQMILYLANAFTSNTYTFLPPTPPPWQGVYHPSADEQTVLKRVQGHDGVVIAILFSTHQLANKNLRHINALIETVEQYGAVALPVFTASTKEPEIGNQGIGWVIDHYLMQGDAPIPHVVINTIGLSMTVFNNEGATEVGHTVSIFDRLKVPVIQAFSTYYSYEKWQESITGLDSMSLVSGIYMPEMDGQIGGYPIATQEYIAEQGSYASQPIAERIDKVVRLAINWASLQRKAEADKKVAIIFHNMPPRNDMIGSAWGLDTPATVYHVVNMLRAAGIQTDYAFEQGDEIIHRIIEGVTNDTAWKGLEDMLKDSVDVIDAATYDTWFQQLPESVTSKMEATWGKAPGDFMAHEGKMPIPGILNGHVFIGLQPPRTLDEKAEEAYHSTDLVCPHQYIAFYKWVKHVFKADVIIHIGTHGTLEWLPGKEKALSNACYPDIAIDDLPHLYIYNISVVGEGIQAKRRSSAALLSHNIPALVESGTYDQLSEIDDLMRDYYQSMNVDPAKIPALQEHIWQLTVSLNLHQDLALDATVMPVDFTNFVKKLHTWVERIKMSIIKDGLHVFGQAPQGEQCANLLRQLVRIKNGHILSINQGVAEAMGYDYDAILDAPDELYEPGTTGHMLIERWMVTAKTLTDEMQTLPAITDYRQFIGYHLPNATGSLAHLIETLTFMDLDLRDRLARITEELDYALKGFQARFLSPGPGGSPTRGSASILPSGKNFYAVDPSTLPTRASWAVGKRMATDLLNRHWQDEQRYPESVAIVLYSGDQMKTNGDDIAEIFYLLGVAPVWLGNTNRVAGLEVIPLDELARPRIDVTARISGLFRDTFPNLIELLDDAVHMVAALDEPVTENYIRKHVQEDIAELTQQGIDQEIATQESMLRVFGCPPGGYGGGVDILVESKLWETQDDLAQISVTWSCHAYSNKVHGDKRPDLYTRRLARTDVTVKNEVSIESDIYDIDDEYIYHGGMLAAVKKFSGKTPRSYYGNSANPERPTLADIREETARIVRARIVNPKWIEGLKRHGFKGAQDVSYTMDNVFGWDATANIVEDWMYEAMADHFLFNDENRQWMNEVNPYATHHITERLLEAAQRGMWHAREETLEKLKQLYLESEGNLESAFHKI